MTLSPDARSKALSQPAAQTQRLLVVRLGTFHRAVKRSASIAYGREIGCCDNDWILLSFIGEQDQPVSLTEIASRLLMDKAQVSRVIARLVEVGMLARDQERGPLQLTKKGREVFVRIKIIRHERNRALLKSISPEDLEVLDRVLDKLFSCAHAMLDEERRLASKPELPAAQRIPRPGFADSAPHPDSHRGSVSNLLVANLQVLLRLFGQSAKLAYGRATGLPNSDYLTLNHIVMNAPVTLTDLTALLDRDKSQVSRSLTRLISRGCAQIGETRGNISSVVTVTPAGEAAFATIVLEARRRNEKLLADLSLQERDALESTMDRLIENALRLRESLDE